jgi:hypothetical protein
VLSESAEPVARSRGRRVLEAVALLVTGLSGAMAGALEILLVPLRVGAVLVPVSVPLAVVGNLALARLARDATGRTAAALLPLGLWLVVVLTLSLRTDPEQDVLVRAESGEPYVFYALLLGGVIAAAWWFVSAPTRRPLTR